MSMPMKLDPRARVRRVPQLTPMRRRLQVWFVPCGLLLASLSAGAAEPVATSTPYQTLYGVLAPVHAIRAYDHLVAHERIASSSPDVEPQAIRIVIHAKRGDIVVPVAADGSVDFPVDEALHAENPQVETNQPKGSLALSVTAGLRLTDTLQVPWAQIDAALAQADDLAAKSGAGAAARKASGVEFRFAPAPVASLTVQGRSERLLKADADGRIVVMRAMIVDSEKPSLQFSRRPDSAVPFEDP